MVFSSVISAIVHGCFGLGTQTGARFGGASASQSYAVRVKWLVASLLSIIALLCTAMVLLYWQIQPPPPTPVEQPVAGISSSPKTTAILIARRRIEAGMQMDASMFDIQDMSPSYVPEGAVLASDRQLLQGKFAKELINTGFPVSRDLVADHPIADDVLIPPGFRAISIPIDEVSSVSYQIQPNKRVDVLLTFTYDGEPAVVPVVETAKIVSIGSIPGQPNGGAGAKTATLLVTADDALKIELAKQYGKLGLVRAGDEEVPKGGTQANPLTGRGLFKPGSATPAPEAHVDGRMVMNDPKTGRQFIYSLVGGRWKMETNQP